MSDEFRDSGTPPLMITDDNGNVWKRVTGPGVDDGILFTFPINPIAHQRSRNKQGQVLPYLPKRMREYYKDLEGYALEQMPVGSWPLTEPLGLDIFFGKQWSQIRINPAGSPRLLRGDLDNYTKSILDGLQKVLWADDKQISRLTVEEVDVDLTSPQEELL